MTTKTTKATKTAKATTGNAKLDQAVTRATAKAKAKATPAMTAAVNVKTALDAKAAAPGAGTVITARTTVENRVAALNLKGAKLDYTGTNNGADERVWWVLIPGAKEHTDNVCLGKSASLVKLANVDTDDALWMKTASDIRRKFDASAKRAAAVAGKTVVPMTSVPTAKSKTAKAAAAQAPAPGTVNTAKTRRAAAGALGVPPATVTRIGGVETAAPAKAPKPAAAPKAAPVAKAGGSTCTKCGFSLSGKRTLCRNEGACTKRQAVA